MVDLLFKGEPETPYHKTRGLAKPVVKMKDGKIIKQYRSINEAARDNNIYSSNISDVIHGYHSQTHGYEWKYADYVMPKGLKKPKKKNGVAIRQCKVMFEKKFESKTLASEFIKSKDLTDAKIVFTRNRDKKQQKGE